MAEDNAAADVEVGQGELRNLHIEGTKSRVCCDSYDLLHNSKFFQMMIDLPMPRKSSGAEMR